jgi:hypothetical protein
MIPEPLGRQTVDWTNAPVNLPGHSLAAVQSTEGMGPYLDFAMAVMHDANPTTELEVIRQLPLEKRCVWRVASVLEWGFADVDDLSVSADRQTLTTEDSAKVMELLAFRPVQFCIFLKALIGEEEMVRTMFQAIGMAKQL